MYHSVTDRPPAQTRRLAVRPGELTDQLGHLKDAGFTPLTFSDLATTLRDDSSALPTRPVVITFDDGYADFHSEALPILDQFGFAATVFVTTGWLDDAGPHAAGRPLDRTLTWSQVKKPPRMESSWPDTATATRSSTRSTPPRSARSCRATRRCSRTRSASR